MFAGMHILACWCQFYTINSHPHLQNYEVFPRQKVGAQNVSHLAYENFLETTINQRM